MLCESRAELVTEWVDGDSMTGAIARHPLSFENAEHLCMLAGKWLAAFHGAHVLASGPLDIHGKLGQVDEMLRDTPVRSVNFDQAVEFLTMSAIDAARASLPRSWIHGDFKLDNMLVATDRVVGIDVQAAFENVVVHDLASFLNHLSLLLLGPRFLRLRLAQAHLLDTFCRSYGLDRGYDVAFALRWSMLFQLLQVWTEVEIKARPIVKRIGLRLGLQQCCRTLVREARKAWTASLRK